jgi:long-chain acyl-CoA synthetase
LRELSVPATFTVEDTDDVVSAVYFHERDDPELPVYQRLADGEWVEVTSAQAASEIRSAAKGLIALGVQPGDRVAILSETRYEWTILDLAILSAGAVTVPIYENSTDEQLRWILQDSGAVVMFAESADHVATVAGLAIDLPQLRCTLGIDTDGSRALEELAALGASVDPGEVANRVQAIRSSDPATLIYTSGTTGHPKGCLLTHSNLLYEIRGAQASVPSLFDAGERLLVFLPLAHVMARAITMAALHNKVTVGFTSDIKNLLATFALFKPTVIVSVPRVFEKVLIGAEQKAVNDDMATVFSLASKVAIAYSKGLERKHGPGILLRLARASFDKLVYQRMKMELGGACAASISGGAPLGPRLCHLYRGIGVTVYEGYGLTETSAAITLNKVGDMRVGSAGKLLPGNSMRIADDGELLVRGGVLFGGYWNNETATANVIEDGWFHTGDIGAIDEDGFLTIVGRKKEIIVTAGGKKLAPEVLEDRLRTHHLVSYAVTIGDSRPFITALITIDPEALENWKHRNGKYLGLAELTSDPELIAAVDDAVTDANKAVSHAEAIRRFRILPSDFSVETGELTPTLKVKRKVIAEKFAGEIEEMYRVV